MLQKLETILLETNPKREIVQDACRFYGTDLNQDRLLAQLMSLHSTKQDGSIDDFKSLISYLKGLNAVEREYYSEVIKVAKLILVMPATNALSERSFSALRRVKTWLRTTIDQVRLNHCMTLHVHKSRTDSLSLIQIGNEFIQRNTSRMHIFGQYDLF